MAQKKYPAVSVIMPVLNEESHLEAAVDSVLRQNYPGDFELLIALGPSRDDTDKIARNIAKSHKAVRLIENPRGLTTVALNQSIREAKHDYIIRVDAHSEPAENYMTRGIELLMETKADLLGGVMAAKGRSSFQKAVAWAYTSRFGVGGAAYHVGGPAAEAESAYLGIFLKSALVRVGGYNESIIRGEDWDLAQRIKATGGLVWFSPELTVTYWPRGRFDRLVKQFYSTGVWRGELTRRSFATASKRYFAPPLTLLVIAVGLGFLSFGHVLGLIPLAGYLLGVAALSITAPNLSLKARVAILVALPTMHFSWGYGFWVGLVRGANLATVDRSRV